MEKSEMQVFRPILSVLLDGEERSLWKRDEVAADRSPDELDHVQNVMEREVAIRRLEVDSHRIRDVKRALQRIEDGTYGVCLRCDEEISIKRLRAVPWVSYCLLCQDLVDRKKSEAALHELLPPIPLGAR